ncbi:MAG: hypothetical protein NC095_04460 [Muribaculum sp.]|nr:hypothetical protein [Muribaculum sp.]
MAATQNKISPLLGASQCMRGRETDITANLDIARYRFQIGEVDMTWQDPDVGYCKKWGCPLSM